MPTLGTPCKTEIGAALFDLTSWVKPEQLAARKNADGTYLRHILGTGGAIWLIQHGENDVGAYFYTEVLDK